MQRVFLRLVLVYVGLSLGGFSIAHAAMPFCAGMDGRTFLPVNNNQVLMWKAQTPNQYHNRAHIQGPVVALLKDKTGHAHMMVQIGPQPQEVIEVIYSFDFGGLPAIQRGMQIEACGDYITAKQGGHMPSPAGAIVHWLHVNPGDRDGGHHPQGYLGVDQVPYGNQYKGRSMNWGGGSSIRP